MKKGTQSVAGFFQNVVAGLSEKERSYLELIPVERSFLHAMISWNKKGHTECGSFFQNVIAGLSEKERSYLELIPVERSFLHAMISWNEKGHTECGSFFQNVAVGLAENNPSSVHRKSVISLLLHFDGFLILIFVRFMYS